MPGVRLNGFLASTAVALFLSAGGALGQMPIAGTEASPTPAPAVDPATPADAASDAKSQAGVPAGAVGTGAAADAKEGSPAASNAVTAPDRDPTGSTDRPQLGLGSGHGTDAASPAAAAASAPQPQPPAVTTDNAAPTPQQQAPTTDTAAAPPVAPTVDSLIADQLHQLIGGKADRIVSNKTERTAIDAFYSGRSYGPIWITDGAPNARAKAAMAYLGKVGADGLDPADYPLPDFKSSADPAAMAEAELRLSATVVTYARHASIGRVAWSRVSPDISYDTKAPEPAAVLAAMADAKDVAEALDGYEPHAPGYLALKAKLAAIRAGKGENGRPAIAYGPVLKVGMQDDRVPQLRERLGVPGDGGTTYDKALADAVKKFQKEHDLRQTGLIDKATIEAINGPRPARETDTIIANMERWRWMPHDLGKTYVMVNLPDYTLRVVNDGKEIWKTRIVIGKPAMPTPIMTAEMKFITVNPTWNVPPSIVNHEYLPALQQDPTVMERMGLKVGHNPDGTVHIWQPPGDRNALGRIRFNFPNKFLVYQHDTPDKYLFAYAKRAYSHGCMRVQDPPKYAEVLLSLVRPNDGYTVDRIKRMYGPNEVNIDFPTFIPVHLTYQTAFVDENGKLQFRDDVYGRDRQLLALMTGPERKVADIPVEHRIDVSHRQVLAIPDQRSFWGGGNAGGGDGGFFARLFGGFAAQSAVPPRPVGQKRRVTRVRGRQTVTR